MKTFKRILIAALIIFGGIFTSQAQIVVRIRPAAPIRVVHPVRPSPRHVWIDGNWVVRNGRYVWVDGYWATPRRGYAWAPGYWASRRGGYVWVPGHWRR